MLVKKQYLANVLYQKKGFFYFELLTGMFLVVVSLNILWGGFLLVLKNCDNAFDLYKKTSICSAFLESEKNTLFIEEFVKDYSIKERVEKVCFASNQISFEIRIISVTSFYNNDFQSVELWEYCGKD